MKKTRSDLDRVEKNWGYELIIANKPAYCGKLLHFYKGKKCSLHFHVRKDETFFLQSGRLKVSLRHSDGRDEAVVMEPGDSLLITPGLMHQMEGLEESDLFEFSTQHFDEDAFRVARGD